MLGSADLCIADQATKRAIHRAAQAAKDAEAAKARREAAEKARKTH
ncbi:hypothetical protein [Streptomyces sp. PvR018]